MLSVCIPVYRYDVRPLVAELLRQLAAARAETAVDTDGAEILVYDDASPADGDWGRAELRQTPGISYVELGQNLGRAAIRNKMAREAANEYVVMMDADGWPNPDFLHRYFFEAEDIERNFGRSSTAVLVTGGRVYAAAPPADKRLHLHWWYGTKRESRSVARREADGWLGFQSNNFMVTRKLLLEHPFPADFSGYGHEDTVWGQQFVSRNVVLYHEDNTVVHLGLEPNDVFLRKQREAVVNLQLLKKQSPHLRTRLIDLAESLPPTLTLARMVPERALLRHLTHGKKPNLYALDLLKLRWWVENTKC